MTETAMLTTIDNPYNPFEDFDLWFQFDMIHGYNSCGYLSRIAKTSEAFSEEENKAEISRAIDEIIQYDFMNVFRKVTKKNFDKVIRQSA